MLALLSPAKSLDFDSPLPTRKNSQPRLLDRAGELIELMREKDTGQIARLMDLSEELAQLNLTRYRDFTVEHTSTNARPAVLAFNGDTYTGLDARARFDERDYTEAQKTVRILSGLYGLLRPLDLIQPYRLEMGTRLATPRGRDLYQWWGATITDVVRDDLATSPGPDAVVMLASDEYAHAVDTGALDARVITPRFEEVNPDGRAQVISFCAKRARGAMAGWMVRNRVRSIRALRDFDGLDYRWDAEASSADRPVFRRARRTGAGA